ncbi:hypothetical protein EDB84DRAFT_1615688 [Lactarius hengduanensis]|nr:hypothetical protein EDB84DRAFT_1615688 [Lactarius hengduanensis]
MRAGAAWLICEHNFRNICMLDPAKQLTSFRRRVVRADILHIINGGMHVHMLDLVGNPSLYNQVQHIVAMLLLISVWLEVPSVMLNTDIDDKRVAAQAPPLTMLPEEGLAKHQRIEATMAEHFHAAAAPLHGPATWGACAMSQYPSTSASSANFETIFIAALEVYKKQTKRDIASHPLAAQLQSCGSPSAILAVLRTQVQTFDRSQTADERWSKWLDPTVNVLYAFSVTLSNGVGLIFPPSNAIFAGIGVLLQVSTILDPTCVSVKPLPFRPSRMSALVKNAVVDLFSRLEYFFKRLEKYIEVRPTAAMTDIIVKIMVEVLSILGIVTKEIGQGRTKKYLKKLIGSLRKEVEGALQRLDALTQEARMAAEALAITRGIDDRVKDVGEKVEGVNEKVEGVDERVRVVVEDIDNKQVSVSSLETHRLIGPTSTIFPSPDATNRHPFFAVSAAFAGVSGASPALSALSFRPTPVYSAFDILPARRHAPYHSLISPPPRPSYAASRLDFWALAADLFMGLATSTITQEVLVPERLYQAPGSQSGISVLFPLSVRVARGDFPSSPSVVGEQQEKEMSLINPCSLGTTVPSCTRRNLIWTFACLRGNDQRASQLGTLRRQ